MLRAQIFRASSARAETFIFAVFCVRASPQDGIFISAQWSDDFEQKWDFSQKSWIFRNFQNALTVLFFKVMDLDFQGVVSA